jgi:hypothetical protein
MANEVKTVKTETELSKNEANAFISFFNNVPTNLKISDEEISAVIDKIANLEKVIGFLKSRKCYSQDIFWKIIKYLERESLSTCEVLDVFDDSVLSRSYDGSNRISTCNKEHLQKNFAVFNETAFLLYIGSNFTVYLSVSETVSVHITPIIEPKEETQKIIIDTGSNDEVTVEGAKLLLQDSKNLRSDIFKLSILDQLDNQDIDIDFVNKPNNALFIVPGFDSSGVNFNYFSFSFNDLISELEGKDIYSPEINKDVIKKYFNYFINAFNSVYKEQIERQTCYNIFKHILRSIEPLREKFKSSCSNLDFFIFCYRFTLSYLKNKDNISIINCFNDGPLSKSDQNEELKKSIGLYRKNILAFRNKIVKSVFKRLAKNSSIHQYVLDLISSQDRSDTHEYIENRYAQNLFYITNSKLVSLYRISDVKEFITENNNTLRIAKVNLLNDNENVSPKSFVILFDEVKSFYNQIDVNRLILSIPSEINKNHLYFIEDTTMFLKQIARLFESSRFCNSLNRYETHNPVSIPEVPTILFDDVLCNYRNNRGLSFLNTEYYDYLYESNLAINNIYLSKIFRSEIVSPKSCIYKKVEFKTLGVNDYRNLANSNRNVQNNDIQLNNTRITNTIIQAFNKGIKRLSTKGKSFRLSPSGFSGQEIIFNKDSIQFENQILKASNVFITFPKVLFDTYKEKVDDTGLLNEFLNKKDKVDQNDPWICCRNYTFRTYAIENSELSSSDLYHISSDIQNCSPKIQLEFYSVCEKYNKEIEKYNNQVDKNNEEIKKLNFHKLIEDYHDLSFKKVNDSFLPVSSLFNIHDKSFYGISGNYKHTYKINILYSHLLGSESFRGYAQDSFYSVAKLLYHELNTDCSSELFSTPNIVNTAEDLDFNSLAERFIDHALAPYCITLSNYDIFKESLNDKIPVGEFFCISEMTLGSVQAKIEVKVSDNAKRTTNWYVNGNRIRRDEIRPLLRRALCFEDQESFNAFIEDVKKTNLKSRHLLSKGVVVDIVTNRRDKISVLLEFAKNGRSWYLIVRNSDNTIFKKHKIEGGVTKFSNLAKNNSNAIQYVPDSFMDLFKNIPTFGMESFRKLISTGLSLANEAVARSRKLLEDTVKMVNAQYVTHQYGTKSISGYKVTGQSGTNYLVACDKITTKVSDPHGSDKLGVVYVLPHLTYVCIVDKSNDQKGYDIVVNRLLALKNDSFVARNVTTLNRHLNNQENER